MQDFGLDEKIVSSIVEILKKYEQVESAVIFGSRARGDYKKTSDIDIALYGNDLTHTINTKIFYDIDGLYFIYMVDLINMNSLSDTDRLKQNIIKEGVEIYARKSN